MATAPRKSLFSNTPLTWSDGLTKFNGFLVVAFIPPTASGADWPRVDFFNQSPGQALPLRAIIPVTEGVINQSLGLFYSADVQPPNSQYVYWIYDTTSRQIAGPSSLFTVIATPLTLPSLTITIPVTDTTIPSLDS